MRRGLFLLLCLATVAGLLPLGIRGLGYWPVVADPLEKARAIVSLWGHLPVRAMEAVLIYRQGCAPEV